MLDRGTALTRRFLHHHSTVAPDASPEERERQVSERFIMGDSGSLTRLCSYSIGGIEVLVVWTYMENDALHILFRRSRSLTRYPTAFRGMRPGWPLPPLRPWVPGV